MRISAENKKGWGRHSELSDGNIRVLKQPKEIKAPVLVKKDTESMTLSWEKVESASNY